MDQLTSPFGNGPADLKQPTTDTAAQGDTAQSIEPGQRVYTEGMDVNLNKVVNRSPSDDATSSEEALMNAVEKLPGSNASDSPMGQPQVQGQPGIPPQQGAGFQPPTGYNGGIAGDMLRRVSSTAAPDAKAAIINQEYGKGSAQVDNEGRVMFKKPGTDYFVPISAQMSDVTGYLASANKLLSDGNFNAAMPEYHQVMGALGSYLNSKYGSIMSAAANMSAMSVGAAATNLLMPEVGVPLSIVRAVGAAIGSGGEAYLENKMSNAELDDTLKRTPNPSLSQKEAQQEFSDNFIGAGLVELGGGIVSAGLSRAAKGVQACVDEFPMNRVRAAVGLQAEVENLSRLLGSSSLKETGENVISAFDGRVKTLADRYIVPYDKEVALIAKQNGYRVDPHDIMDGMKAVMERNGFIFQPGDYTVKDFPQSVYSKLTPTEMSKLKSAGYLPGVIKEFQTGPVNSDGMIELYHDFSTLKDSLNRTDGMPGLDIGAVREFEKKYAAYGAYQQNPKNPFIGAGKAVAREVDNIFGQTRDKEYKKILLASEDSGRVNDYADGWGKYQKEKDLLRDTADNMIGKTATYSPEIMMKTALTTNSPMQIRQLKQLFGDKNPELIQSLRGAYVQAMMQDAKYSNGMLNLPKFVSNMENANPTVRGEILTDTEHKNIMGFVKQMNGLMMSQISSGEANNVTFAQKLGGLYHLVTAGVTDTPSEARIAYSVFGQNVVAFDALTEKTLPELQALQSSRQEYIKAKNTGALIGMLSNYRAMSDIVNGKLVPGGKLATALQLTGTSGFKNGVLDNVMNNDRRTNGMNRSPQSAQ